MVGRLAYLVVFAAAMGLVLAVAGCGGAQVKPDIEPPAEEPKEKPEEVEEPGEKAEEPEEAPAGESELQKQARLEIAAAVAKAKELSGQKKFDEALAELNTVIEKYGANLLLVAKARELYSDTEKAKAANAEAIRRETADKWLEGTIARSRALRADNKFDEALKAVETIPEECAYDEIMAAVAAEKQTIFAAKQAHEEEVARLKEAEDRFNRLPEEIAEPMEKKEFDKVFELLDQYLEEFGDTEYADKVRELRQEAVTAQGEWEAHLEKKQKATDLFNETMEKAGEMAAVRDYAGAKQMIEDYPGEYEEFGYGPQLQGKWEEVDQQEQAYKKELHEKAAKAAYDALTGEVKALVDARKFDEAVQKLDAYPQEYNDTQWPELVGGKKVDVLARKAAYEAEEARKKKAREDADAAITKARGFAKNKEFDKALQELRAYPEEFKDTDANADVAKEIADTETQKKKYEKDQMTMGIVIAVVIVVLLVIVIAISSAGRKKKAGVAPAAADEEEPAYEEEFVEEEPEAAAAEPMPEEEVEGEAFGDEEQPPEERPADE
jgi:hypothetical protein